MEKRRTSTKYIKFVQKAVIKRLRKSPLIDDACKIFMENAFVPSR
jgi:hypothetical protein